MIEHSISPKVFIQLLASQSDQYKNFSLFEKFFTFSNIIIFNCHKIQSTLMPIKAIPHCQNFRLYFFVVFYNNQCSEYGCEQKLILFLLIQRFFTSSAFRHLMGVIPQTFRKVCGILVIGLIVAAQARIYFLYAVLASRVKIGEIIFPK